MTIRRGDIFYADLSPVVGSEQGGVRPVLIVQNDVGNRYSPTVIAAAITSKLGKAKLPTHIDVYADRVGLAPRFRDSARADPHHRQKTARRENGSPRRFRNARRGQRHHRQLRFTITRGGYGERGERRRRRRFLKEAWQELL